MSGSGPLALDGQSIPLEHGFDVFFAEARSVVFDQKSVVRRCDLHSFDAVVTVDVANSSCILIGQSPHEIVFKLNLCHGESSGYHLLFSFHSIWRIIPSHISASCPARARRRTSLRILESAPSVCT